MTDAVARLMALAEGLAQEVKDFGYLDASPSRQALEAELTRLFTPLSDEQIATVYFVATGQTLRPQDNVLAHKFAKAIEQQHGIGGES